MKIIWSPEAQNDYWENIQYLLDEFSVEQAQKFIEAVDAYVKTINQNPKAFQKTGFKNTRSVPVVAKISLYYIETTNTIELLRFFNNLQNPDKRDI